MPAPDPATALTVVRSPAPHPDGRGGPALPSPKRMGNVRAALLIVAGLAIVAVALHLWWPAGVVIGLVLGVATVLGIGGAQQHAAEAAPVADGLGDLRSLFEGGEHASVAAASIAVPAAAPADAAGPIPATAPASHRTAPAAAPAVVAERTTPGATPTPDRTPPVTAAAPARTPPAAPAPAAQRAPAPVVDAHPALPVPGVRADLRRLKKELGDDYPDFARAARLVVSTQYASAARLQRDLHLPYSRARRLLAGLESEHFVGPATGTLPRQVLLPKERLPEVERLFAGV